MTPTDDRDGDTTPRRATSADVPALARLFLRSREANAATIPPIAHPPETVEPFLARVVGTDEVWLVEVGGVPAAFLALDDDGVDHLYADPDHVGAGLGSRLVDLAKERRPGGLALWTFVSNAGARRFYERHGFAVVGGTDGDNEEGAPDVRMEWRP